MPAKLTKKKRGSARSTFGNILFSPSFFFSFEKVREMVPPSAPLPEYRPFRFKMPLWNPTILSIIERERGRHFLENWERALCKITSCYSKSKRGTVGTKKQDTLFSLFVFPVSIVTWRTLASNYFSSSANNHGFSLPAPFFSTQTRDQRCRPAAPPPPPPPPRPCCCWRCCCRRWRCPPCSPPPPTTATRASWGSSPGRGGRPPLPQCTTASRGEENKKNKLCFPYSFRFYLRP